MAGLRTAVQMYAAIDDEIIELNRRLFTLRYNRRAQETQMVAILRNPEFVAYNKLSVSTDNSTIRVYRPLEWNKSWSLSKANLLKHLTDYFASGEIPTARGCNDYICDANAASLVATEFSIERSVAH